MRAGNVTPEDAYLIHRSVRKGAVLTTRQQQAANVTLDSVINEEDADFIVKKYLKKIVLFPRESNS